MLQKLNQLDKYVIKFLFKLWKHYHDVVESLYKNDIKKFNIMCKKQKDVAKNNSV